VAARLKRSEYRMERPRPWVAASPGTQIPPILACRRDQRIPAPWITKATPHISSTGRTLSCALPRLPRDSVDIGTVDDNVAARSVLHNEARGTGIGVSSAPATRGRLRIVFTGSSFPRKGPRSSFLYLCVLSVAIEEAGEDALDRGFAVWGPLDAVEHGREPVRRVRGIVIHWRPVTGEIEHVVEVGVEDVGQKIAGSRVRDALAANPVTDRGGTDPSPTREIGLAPIPVLQFTFDPVADAILVHGFIILDRIRLCGYYVRMHESRFRASHLEAVTLSQGRTKRWVAHHAGFSQGMLSHVLAGRKTIGVEAGQRIAMVLGVPSFVLIESATADPLAADEAAREVQR
jgi:hypothetical protein